VLGIAFRDGAEVILTAGRPLLTELNESPRPAYDLVDVGAYIKHATEHYLELYAGSGCPFACTFCSTSLVWQRKYRTMSPARIVDEMEYLHREYGASAFNLIHDNLTSKKSFVAAIAALIRERGLKVRWGFSSRTDTIDKETIFQVSEAGCDYIFFGVESGSSRIQATMGKRLKLSRIDAAIENCIQHGISPTTSFILGFPDETLADITATIRLAFRCRIRGARRSFINLLSAYTGTHVMQEEYEKMKFFRNSANSTMVSFLEERHYAMIEADKFIFANYYSLDYSKSPISAFDFMNLVDFFTICLFRYRYSISFLVDELNLDPLEIYRAAEPKVRSLSVENKNRLSLALQDTDLMRGKLGQKIRSEGCVSKLKTLLSFDEALWLAFQSESATLFCGPVEIGGNRSSFYDKHGTRHFMLRKRGHEVHVEKIDPSLYQLYELQGLPSIRCSEQSGSLLRQGKIESTL
jgi:hypothetical protein